VAKKDERGLKSWQWFPRDSAIYGPGIYTLVQTAKQASLENARVAEGAANQSPPTPAGPSSSPTPTTAPTAAAAADNVAMGIGGIGTPTGPTQIDGFVLLVKLLFEWIPQRKLSEASTLLISQEAAPIEIESKFSFTAFASRIPNLKLSDQKQLDLVVRIWLLNCYGMDTEHIGHLQEAVVLLVVADILYLALKTYGADRLLDRKTIDKLAQLCLLLARPTKPRALDPQVWSTLNNTICIQWANVLGQLSPYMYVNGPKPQTEPHTAKHTNTNKQICYISTMGSLIVNCSLPMMTTFISQDMNRMPSEVQLSALNSLRLRFDVRLAQSLPSTKLTLTSPLLSSS